MKKRAYFIALSLGLLVVSVSFTGIFADENKQVTSLVKMVNDNKLIKDPDKVVFKVNGKPVLAREFVKEKNLLINLFMSLYLREQITRRSVNNANKR